LLLPLDFNEVDDPTGFVQDASQWKFFVNAKYEGGIYLSVNDGNAIDASMPFIRKAYGASFQ